MWSGVVIHTPDRIPAVVEAADKFGQVAPANSMLAVGIGCASGTEIPTILISPFYNGSEAEGTETFKPFFDIEPAMSMMETRPYVQQVALNYFCANFRTHPSYITTRLALEDIKKLVQ